MKLNALIQDAIYDMFAYEEDDIVVLNNRNSEDENFKKLLLLGKVVNTSLGNVIYPISKDKYDEIAEYYLNLKNAFLMGAEEDE